MRSTGDHKLTNEHQLPYPSPPYTESEFKHSRMRGGDAYLNGMGPAPYPPQFLEVSNPPLSPLTPAFSEASCFVARAPGSAPHSSNSYGTSLPPSTGTHPWLRSSESQSTVRTIDPFALHHGKQTPHVPFSFQEAQQTENASSAVSFENFPGSYASSYYSPSELQNETTEGFTIDETSAGRVDEQLLYRHASCSPFPSEHFSLEMVKVEYAQSDSYLDDEYPYESDEDFKPSHRPRARAPAADADGMFVCERPGCSRRSKRRSNITNHMKTHIPDRDRPWKCHEIGCEFSIRGFERQTDLNRHWSTTHLKAKPFRCRRCHRSFSRRDGLIRHGKGGCKYLDCAPRRTSDHQVRQSRPRRSTGADLGPKRCSGRRARNSDTYISNEEALRLARLNEDVKVAVKIENNTQGDPACAPSPFIKQEE